MTTKKIKSLPQHWQPSEASESQYKHLNKLEADYDTRKYEKTYNIIYKVTCLTVNMFQVKKKEELIKELQNTVNKLNELLLDLKNDNKEK